MSPDLREDLPEVQRFQPEPGGGSLSRVPDRLFGRRVILREDERPVWHFGPALSKGRFDRGGQLDRGIETAQDEPNVVQVLHAAVDAPQRDRGLELLPRRPLKAGTPALAPDCTQEAVHLCALRPGRDYVAEPDIDLERVPQRTSPASDVQTHAVVFRALGDPLGTDSGAGSKARPSPCAMATMEARV